MRESAIKRRRDRLLELQEPIYNYVLRLVRDPELASDLTQEVYLRALRQPPDLPIDRLRPWLFGVASNVVSRSFRDASRRRRRERAVARKPAVSGQASRLDSEEIEEIVHRELAALPFEQRSLLLLHYFGSLNQREMAEALGIPRTTVADRLRQALGALKGRVGGSGQVALIPLIEEVLRSTPSVPVPPALAAEIGGLAASAGSLSPIVAGGGVLVTKQALGVSLFVAVLCLGGGVWIGRSGVEAARKEEASTELDRLEVERKRWKHERSKLIAREKKLAQRLAETRSSHDELRRRLEAEKDELTTRLDELARQLEPPARMISEKYADIDWDDLAQVIAKNTAAFEAMAEGMRQGKGSVTSLAPQHQASFQELMVKWNRAGAQARTETPFPFLDPELLPTLLDVMLRDTAGLDDRQLDQVAREALRSLEANELPEGATPLEAFAIRNRVVDDSLRQLSESLRAEQAAGWQKIQPVFEGILRGDHRYARVGLGDLAMARSQLLREWKRHYPLESVEGATLSTLSDRYLEQAGELLDQSENAEGAEGKEALNDDFLELQLEVERELLGLLRDEDRGRLQERYPIVVSFGRFQGFNGDTRVTGGF